MSTYNWMVKQNDEDAPGNQFSVEDAENPWNSVPEWEPTLPQAPDFTRPNVTGPGGFQSPGEWERPITDSRGQEDISRGYLPWTPTGGNPSSPGYNLGVPVWGTPPVEGEDNKGTGGPVTPDMANFWTDDTRAQAVNNWLNTMLPLTQMYQNSYQYERDADEANRRWDVDTQWQQGLEQFDVERAMREQGLAELQAQIATNQWNEQFDWQKQGDLIAQQIAQREIALAEESTGRELSLAERKQVYDETYKDAMLGIQRQQLENELIAARYGAFGRAQAPAQWVANWA